MPVHTTLNLHHAWDRKQLCSCNAPGDEARSPPSSHSCLHPLSLSSPPHTTLHNAAYHTICMYTCVNTFAVGWCIGVPCCSTSVGTASCGLYAYWR
jgi:hypothetical protein